MRKGHIFLIAIALLLNSCGTSTQSENSGFLVKQSNEGVELFENGEAVFFYQKTPRSRDGEFYFNHYLHPLYSLNGDTLTEEFPDDHFHHRGVFWAWHQLFMDDLRLGDQWMMDGITQEVTSVKEELNENSAVLNIDVTWKSAALEDPGAFLNEQTTIIVHSRTETMRIIDFEISLTALVPGLKIGGSEDEKGYGGFSARIKLPDDLVFTAESGQVTPQKLQITAGPWMDCSGTLDKSGEITGVTIFCHPDTPNYPGTWILRQTKSMQNLVWPGQEPVQLSKEMPTVLKYRMVIHKGNSKAFDPEKLI